MKAGDHGARPGLALRVVLLALVVGAPGCRREAVPRPGPRLRLLFPGVGPREPLRYRFVPKRVIHYRLRSEERRVGARAPAPPRELYLSYAVDRVKGERAQVRWRVEPAPGLGPEARPGASLWLQISDRGAVEAVSAGRGRAAASPTLRQTLTSFHPRFPEAPLGQGARWLEVRRHRWRPVRGLPPFDAEIRARYTVLRFAPCGQTRCADLSVRVSVNLSQQVGSRRLRGQGTGQADVRFDLGRGVILSVSSHTELEVRAEAGSASVTEILRVDQRLEEVRAPLEAPRPATRARAAPRSASGSAPRGAARGR